jgi:hypothetical protein
MAIPLLVSTDTTVELVYTADPCVDAEKGSDGYDRWALATDAVCKRGADLVTVRALNGEERWRAESQGEGPDRFYFWADLGVVGVSSTEDVKIWLRRLDVGCLIKLASCVMLVTYGRPIGALEGEPEEGTFREDD